MHIALPVWSGFLTADTREFWGVRHPINSRQEVSGITEFQAGIRATGNSLANSREFPGGSAPPQKFPREFTEIADFSAGILAGIWKFEQSDLIGFGIKGF